MASKWPDAELTQRLLKFSRLAENATIANFVPSSIDRIRQLEAVRDKLLVALKDQIERCHYITVESQQAIEEAEETL